MSKSGDEIIEVVTSLVKERDGLRKNYEALNGAYLSAVQQRAEFRGALTEERHERAKLEEEIKELKTCINAKPPKEVEPPLHLSIGNKVRMRTIQPAPSGRVHTNYIYDVCVLGIFEGREAACLKDNKGHVEIYDLEDLRIVNPEDIIGAPGDQV